MRRKAIFALAVLVAVLLTAGASTTGATTTYTHVVWVVMENHSYSQIIGSSAAPYTNYLAKTYGNAKATYAETHPSLPNYIAMTSGGTQGIKDDLPPSYHRLAVNNIFHQLGTGARSYAETMPSNCYKKDYPKYALGSNPAVYYTNWTPCSTQDVPLTSTPNFSARFTFVTPNLCHDMHSCSISAGDTWLKGFIPKILNSTPYKSGSTVIFLTWDEDNFTSTNHVPMIVISPTSRGIVSSTRFTHYSMQRTSEEILGKPLIGNAASATSMRATFHLG